MRRLTSVNGCTIGFERKIFPFLLWPTKYNIGFIQFCALAIMVTAEGYKVAINFMLNPNFIVVTAQLNYHFDIQYRNECKFKYAYE